MINQNIFKDLLDALKERDKKPQPYDSTAEVRRIEGNTAWVRIPGSEDETPVKLTINAQPGDSVQVRVSGGSAFLVGNASAPPTDDKKAVAVEQKVGIVEKVVETVKSVAESAAKIAGNTRQYFWFTSEGADTGAHITEKPQEEFLADPANGGGNLLARSNGIAVRDGLTELATFGASAAQIGQDGSGHIRIETNRMVGETAYSPYFEFKSTGQTITEVMSYSWGDWFASGYPLTPNSGLVARLSKFISSSITVTLTKVNDGTTYTTTVPKTDASYRTIAVGDQTYYFAYSSYFFRSWVDSHPASATDVIVNVSFTYSVTQDAPSYLIGTGEADAPFSAALNRGTSAKSESQTVVGKYNAKDEDSDYGFIVGNGTDDANRSNAFAVKWDGTVETAQGTLTAQTATTTWTKPDIYNSNCTIEHGGYYREGKHVYVQVQLKLAATLAVSTERQIFSSMPAPAFNVALSVYAASRGGAGARIDSSGKFYLVSSSAQQLSTSNTIIITGHYTSA